MQLDMSGQTAVVTGSTSGIGRAIAEELASHGAHVVINGRSPERGDPVVTALEDGGGSAEFRAADINDYDQVKRLVEGVVADNSGIDILVPNGAAISAPAPDFFRGTDPEDLLAFAESMFANRLYVIKAALEPMIEDGGGRIVSIGADAGRWPTPGETGPGSASAALMMATKVLAWELGRWDITVNAVSISVTEDTPALKWVLEESPAALVFKEAMERQQFEVTAADVAQTVAFLAGASSGGATTGQLISVNGGVSFPG